MNQFVDVALQASELNERLLEQVYFESNVLVDRVILISVFVEVDTNSFEPFSFDVADKTLVVVVFLNEFLLAPHFCEGIDDDT